MFTSEHSDLRLLDDIDDATRALVEVADVDPDGILLIGARCRDVLHSGLGHTTTTRATRDLDLGIAVADWQGYERLANHFRRIGSNGVGYRIADRPVDVVPFGPRVEDPRGIARPASRRDGIPVFGFPQFIASAHTLGSDIRRQLPPHDASALVALVARQGLHDLTSRLIDIPRHRELRRQIVDAFGAGLEAEEEGW